MNTSKKIIIAVAAVLVIAAIAFGIGYAVLPKQNVPELDVSGIQSTPVVSKNAYVVGKPPYISDCVFETQIGMDSYFRANRSTGNALEVVLQSTKDGELVVLSGDLNEYSNAKILYGDNAEVSSLTLEELKAVNLAFNFKAEDGTMPYKSYSVDPLLDQVNVLSLRDFMEYYCDPMRSRFILYVSFKNEGSVADPEKALDTLYALTQEFDAAKKILFRTDDHDLAAYIDKACPELQRTATAAEAKSLYNAALFGKAQKELPYSVVYVDADSHFAEEKFIHFARNNGIGVILDNVPTDQIASLYNTGVNGFAENDVEDAAAVLKDAIQAARAAEKNGSAAK